ncbi:aminoacyl-tRNA hydrolase [Endothiovibrio diazotrophicus]
MGAISLIVGLGNPGRSYEETRHNAGFWLVDELARRYGGHLKAESRFHGELCSVRIAGHEVRLLKPGTFMNRSGQAIHAVAHFYKLPAESVLVAHDELDLPPGTVRFKRDGGHGGHNGLRDTIARLGKVFPRIRLGIGHPGHRDQVHDYVLGRPSGDDRHAILAAIDEACDALPQLLEGDVEKAMNRLHSR